MNFIKTLDARDGLFFLLLICIAMVTQKNNYLEEQTQENQRRIEEIVDYLKQYSKSKDKDSLEDIHFSPGPFNGIEISKIDA